MLYVNPLEAQASPYENTNMGPGTRETQALEEFERLFLFQLLRQLRQTVPKDGIFGGSSQQRFFEEMLDDHLAGAMAKSGQFGIADQISRQMAPPAVTPPENPEKGLPLDRTREGLGLAPLERGLPLPPGNLGFSLESKIREYSLASEECRKGRGTVQVPVALCR